MLIKIKLIIFVLEDFYGIWDSLIFDFDVKVQVRIEIVMQFYYYYIKDKLLLMYYNICINKNKII